MCVDVRMYVLTVYTVYTYVCLYMCVDRCIDSNLYVHTECMGVQMPCYIQCILWHCIYV